MNEQKFIETLTEIMDTEESIAMDSVLEDIEEWDSLSYVSFLAMCSKSAKTPVTPEDVRNAKTVRDLYKLITE